MNTRRCLQIADRMNALLLQQLAQGVDGLRMVAEPLYARDVLLVCEAMPGTELAELAQHFRVAAMEKAPPNGAPPAASGAGPHQEVRRRSRSHERTPEPARSGSGHGANLKSGENANTGANANANANADTGAAASSGVGTSVWSRIASGFGFTNPGGSSLPDSQPHTDPGDLGGPGSPGSAAAPPRRRWFSPPRRSAGK